MPAADPPLAASAPLRVVAMIPRSAADREADADRSWLALSKAMAPLLAEGRIDLERLDGATEGSLKSRLGAGPCHVLHFIGQVQARPRAQYATLLLEGAGPRGRAVTSQFLSALLQPHAALRLLVLQATETSTGPLAGTVASLVESGLSAVVAIPGDLNRAATAALIERLYSALCAGGPATEILAGLRRVSAAIEFRVNPGVGSEPLLVAATARPPSPQPAADPKATIEPAARTRSALDRKRQAGTFDVFLCHNRADKPAVKAIAHRLQEREILPWLDEWELPPGQPWQPLLEQQIGQIASAAVFVGSAGVGPWQQQELYGLLSEFVARRSPVIPVLLPDAPATPKLPLFLKAMTWVDFRMADPDPFERLIWGITGQRTSTQ
jgi:hypothetical protein